MTKKKTRFLVLGLAFLFLVNVVTAADILTSDSKKDPVIEFKDRNNVSLAGMSADEITIYEDALSVDNSNMTIKGDKVEVDLYEYIPRSPFVKQGINILYDASREENGTVTFTHTGLPETVVEFRIDQRRENKSSSGTISGTLNDWSTKEVQISDFAEPGIIGGFVQNILFGIRGWIDTGTLSTGQQIGLGLGIIISAGAVTAVAAGGIAATVSMIGALIVLPIIGLWPTWLVFLLAVVVGIAGFLSKAGS